MMSVKDGRGRVAANLIRKPGNRQHSRAAGVTLTATVIIYGRCYGGDCHSKARAASAKPPDGGKRRLRGCLRTFPCFSKC